MSIPPAVRILPMDSKSEPGFAGCSIEVVQQQYFLTELVRPAKLAGTFHFHKVGLRAEPGTVVLFQFASKIIASAVLIGIERYEAAKEGDYRGAYLFDVNSVTVFDPVDAAVLGKIWPKIERLGQAKWSLDPKRYERFTQRLTGVESARQ